MENQDNINTNKPQALKRMSRRERRHADLPGDPLKGRALYKWSAFVFVLAMFGAALTCFVYVLPILLPVLGTMIILAWLIAIVASSIFTLFMIWYSDDAKSFFDGWINFGRSFFDVGRDADRLAYRAVPVVLIVGGALLIICWSMLSIGLSTDKARKKSYIGMMIALGIITLVYVIFFFVNLRKYYFL